MLDQLYRQLVMDHAKHRRNHRELKEEGTSYLSYKNPTCGDVMTLYWKMSPDHIIEEVSFIGEGCSISMASCSMMTELIKGKKLEEVKKQKEGMEELIKKGRDLNG
ncbi:Fe-S cluster assembly sulfur transfer protein SufU [Thalassobacillus sp. C254]|uniref:Fe-S cluster assembly sulfur transfer protein SufU n=1 Tax=Thalassobacillus sp. C254 TaxID=1225341 RepID=UPI000B1C39C4|nr:SUF system NifU family Fe-S cluster assembly protein [Thalassobacillus sp. C254]